MPFASLSGMHSVRPFHSVVFTNSLLLSALISQVTVCALIFQVNNRVVHTEFHLHEEPIKVSLVMESTLTRFVYF